MQPVINILIRHTANRDALFQRCIESIRAQTYLNYRIIVCYDYSLHHFTVPDVLFDFYVEPNVSLGPFFYNDYCNKLKAKVDEGFFFFLDDDDYLANKYVLEELVKCVDNDTQAVVMQMERDNGRVKPSLESIVSKRIESGKIGLPCLLLRHDFKNWSDIGVEENGDFIWIDEMLTVLENVKFINLVVVKSPQRSFGR